MHLRETGDLGLPSTAHRYPDSQPNYFEYRGRDTEFGHNTIFATRLSQKGSDFHVLDLRSGDASNKRVRRVGGEAHAVTALLAEEAPAIRIFLFSTEEHDADRRWKVMASDLEAVFSRFAVQPSFVHRLKAIKFSAGPETNSHPSADESEHRLSRYGTSTRLRPCYIANSRARSTVQRSHTAEGRYYLRTNLHDIRPDKQDPHHTRI